MEKRITRNSQGVLYLDHRSPYREKQWQWSSCKHGKQGDNEKRMELVHEVSQYFVKRSCPSDISLCGRSLGRKGGQQIEYLQRKFVRWTLTHPSWVCPEFYDYSGNNVNTPYNHQKCRKSSEFRHENIRRKKRRVSKRLSSRN